jgi:hypothetical protein
MGLCSYKGLRVKKSVERADREDIPEAIPCLVPSWQVGLIDTKKTAVPYARTMEKPRRISRLVDAR